MNNLINKLKSWLKQHPFLSIVIFILVFSKIILLYQSLTGFRKSFYITLNPPGFFVHLLLLLPIGMAILTVLAVVSYYFQSRNKTQAQKEAEIEAAKASSAGTVFIWIAILFLGMFELEELYCKKLDFVYHRTPFVTTKTSIVDYQISLYRNKGRNTFVRDHTYTLRFADNVPIPYNEVQVVMWHKGSFTSLFPTQTNDCLMVQYRQNYWYIEWQPIKNLGQMSIDECLAKD